MAATLMSQEWDFEGAEREFKRAIELNPNYASAHHWYANGLLGSQGRYEESIREMREAKRLDPFSPMVASNLGDQLLAAGRYKEAEAEYREVLETWPNFEYPRERLGLVLLKEGRYEEAISIFKQTMEQRPIDSTTDLIEAYMLTGREDEARKLLSELELKSKQMYISDMQMAFAYAGAGENERAIELIQQAAGQKSNQLWINLNEPAFDKLRSDPRIQNLLKIIEPKR